MNFLSYYKVYLLQKQKNVDALLSVNSNNGHTYFKFNRCIAKNPVKISVSFAMFFISWQAKETMHGSDNFIKISCHGFILGIIASCLKTGIASLVSEYFNGNAKYNAI